MVTQTTRGGVGYLSIGQVWVCLDDGQAVSVEDCTNALDLAQVLREMAARNGFTDAVALLEETAGYLRASLEGDTWR